MAIELLGVCGSLRKGSYNRKLMFEAARVFGDAEYREADLNLPLFNEDLEEEVGIPEPVQRLAGDLKWAKAVIIGSPEYNKSLTGVLKNALDWTSRVKGGLWRDKPVAVVGASPGRAGADRSQFALRLALVPFRPKVIPGPEVLLAHADEAFDENGRLTDERTLKSLIEVMEQLKALI